MNKWLGFIKNSYPSLLLAVQSILGVLQLLDVLQVEYVLMTHRFSMRTIFKLPVSLIVPLLILLCLWGFLVILRKSFKALIFPAFSFLFSPVLGLGGVVSIASILAVGASLWFLRRVREYLTWVFMILAGFEAVSLFHWLIFLPLGVNTPFEYFARLEMELSYVTLNVSPYLVLTFVFTCLLKPFHRLIRGKETMIEEIEKDDFPFFPLRTSFFLPFIICFSVLAAFYPYLPTINKIGGDVGVDIRNYLEGSELIENDPTLVFRVFSGERPLIFLVIFVFQKLLSLDALTVIRFLPVFLNPLLALTVYFFAKEVFNDKRAADWATFFTVFGFPIASGMYAYFLTNMLGLCLIYSSLGFLFRSIKGGNKIHLVLAFLFGALLLFTHPWTFDQYFAPLILVILFLPQIFDNSSFYHKISKNILSRARYILIFLLVLLFAIELFKNNVIQGYGGIAALNTVFKSLTSVQQFWYDLILGMNYRFGGFSSNVILIGLALVGVLAMKIRGVPEHYLWILMVATSALFLISDAVVKSRLFYNIPIGVLSALGYGTILKVASSDELKLSFSSFIFLSMVVYLLRSLANLIASASV